MAHPPLLGRFLVLLCDWPLPRPARWLAGVNKPQTPAEEAATLQSTRRSSPMGDELWRQATARPLHLQQTLRPRGRQIGWQKNQKPRMSTR